MTLNPEHLTRIAELREARRTPSQIARMIDRPLADVRIALGMRRLPGPVSDDEIRSIRSHAEAGMSIRWIARHYRISGTTAHRVCADVIRPADATAKARAIGAKKTQDVLARKRRAKARELAARVFLGRIVEVPTWVPGELRDLYERVGLHKGEHEAAAVVRKLKSSGSVACR